jgi:hypothetical protein
LEGSWDSNSLITDQIGLNTAHLAVLKPAEIPQGDVWLTLFFVLLLRTFFAADSKKWALIEKKAVSWLEKQGFDIKNH